MYEFFSAESTMLSVFRAILNYKRAINSKVMQAKMRIKLFIRHKLLYHLRNFITYDGPHHTNAPEL